MDAGEALLVTTKNLEASVRNLQQMAEKAFGHLPMCGTIAEFLVFHKAETVMSLNESQRKELTAELENFLTTIRVQSLFVLSSCGVMNEAELTPAQRVVYDKRMKDFIDNEDHYRP